MIDILFIFGTRIKMNISYNDNRECCRMDSLEWESEFRGGKKIMYQIQRKKSNLIIMKP
jgi:hypothetical protein